MDAPYSGSGHPYSGSSKRPHPHYDREPAERNGRHKRRMHYVEQQRPPPPPPKAAPAEDTVFRILCPGSKIGSVIGKAGSIIKSLRQETRAKIKIVDAVPGVDERVIIISCSEKGYRERGKDRDGGRDGRSRDGDRDDSDREREPGPRDRDGRDRDGDDREGVSPAQEALYRVHARIVDGESNEEDVEDEDAAHHFTTRLLVPNNQIGCLLGKGGKIIEQMRHETGAQIRILPKDQLPGCALPTDELVQVYGDLAVVKKALHAISARLQENPPRERLQGASMLSHPSPLLSGGSLLSSGNFLSQVNSLMAPGNGGSQGFHLGPSLSTLGSLGAGGGGGWQFRSPNGPVLPSRGGGPLHGVKEASIDNELIFRILWPNEKIGSVIGKKGNIIRQLREETGARIKIADAVPGADERVIIVSANESPDEVVSPAVDAVLQVQNRAADFGPEKDGQTTTRLLVPTTQIGCLLGKGGSIISEMRKATRATIRILPKDALPRCALETDELVQIVGDLNVAREALVQITSKLRRNFFQERDTGGGGGSYQSSLSALGLGGHIPSGYGVGHEPGSPGGMYSSMSGLGLQGGRLSSGYGSLGSPPGSWGVQGGGLGDLASFGGGLVHQMQSSGGGYGGGGRSIGGLVTNLAGTTVEVVIPNTAVGSVIGKGGSNIANIRQLSGAKVKLHDPRQGTADRVVEISGTPEQTHAAQNLLQAFILNGQSPSLPGMMSSGYAG